jgi:hypothetical protein
MLDKVMGGEPLELLQPVSYDWRFSPGRFSLRIDGLIT